MSDSIRDKKGLADAKPSASRAPNRSLPDFGLRRRVCMVGTPDLDQALDSMKEFSEKKFTLEYIAR